MSEAPMKCFALPGLALVTSNFGRPNGSALMAAEATAGEEAVVEMAVAKAEVMDVVAGAAVGVTPEVHCPPSLRKRLTS